MRANTTDEFFVAAAPRAVQDALLDPARWWPYARIRAEGDRVTFDVPGFRRRASRVRFEARVAGVRPGEGFTWWLERGEVRGRAEWWLEAFKEGTIAHYYLDIEPGDRGRLRRWSSRVRRHRWAVRRGMEALAPALEGGRRPGESPAGLDGIR